MKPFLLQDPPANYVAGIGRGASGFAAVAPEEPAPAAQSREDREAELIYDRIGRKRKRHADPPPEPSALKRGLAAVTAAQWALIPEVGDMTRKNRRQRALEQQTQRSYAAPDTLLRRPEAQGAPHERSYDVDKNRLILRSLRQTEPLRANLWVALARLEEAADDLEAARALIAEGCAKVPRNEHVWLENIRLHLKTSEGARLCRKIVNSALTHNAHSEKLWLQAVELEKPGDVFSKRQILMKGLEYLPGSAQLWRLLIDLSEDSVRLLEKALALCPHEWDFWLRLVRLVDSTEAKRHLNEAKKHVYQAWIALAELEEKNEGLYDKVYHIIKEGMGDGNWLEDATRASPLTCKAITYLVLENAADNDLEAFSKKYGKPVSTHIREILAQRRPTDIDNWTALFDSEPREEYQNRAIECNPQNSALYIRCANDSKRQGDGERALELLDRGLAALPNDESLWVRKIDLSTSNLEKAAELAKSALHVDSPRVWYKLIHILRALNKEDVLSRCDEAIAKYPACYKLYLQKAQVLGNPKALAVLETGAAKCQNAEIFIAQARIEAENGKPARARAILDSAILKHSSDLLWVEKISLEIGQKEMAAARQLTNKALKLFPTSSALWILYLNMVPKLAHRKNAFMDALKQTNNDSEILVAIGVFFLKEGNMEKAKVWFEKAIARNDGNGDAWGWIYNVLGAKDDFFERFESLKKGKTWIEVTKDPQNLTLKPNEVLQLVALKLKAAND